MCQNDQNQNLIQALHFIIFAYKTKEIELNFISFGQNPTSRNRLAVEQGFYNTVLLLVGIGNLEYMLHEKNCFFFFSCFSLDFKCQKCRLVNLSAIVNLVAQKFLTSIALTSLQVPQISAEGCI